VLLLPSRRLKIEHPDLPNARRVREPTLPAPGIAIAFDSPEEEAKMLESHVPPDPKPSPPPCGPLTELAEGAEPARRLTGDEYGDAFTAGYSLTLRFLVSRGAALHDAEEIAQAAWAKGWECRGQLRNPSHVAVWVNSIAKNMLLNHYDRQQRTRSSDTEATRCGHSRIQDALEVGALLRKCKPKDRALLRLHYIEGYTTAEIAQAVGMTPTAIRLRLMRIRNSIQRKRHVWWAHNGNGGRPKER
jgi:RNA polymerase sigma factor (sigma-70 family)